MPNKIPVGVLGATGAVGQKFVKLLENHPWFELTELAASDRSAGKPYKDATLWRQYTPIPDAIKSRTVKPCEPTLDCRVVFSGLDSSVAGEVEENFARAGYVVLTNSKNHRMDEDVPLLVPEVNPDHLALIKPQRARRGDRKSTRLNSSHSQISYAVFCLKKKNQATSHNRTPPDRPPPARCTPSPALHSPHRPPHGSTADARKSASQPRTLPRPSLAVRGR